MIDSAVYSIRWGHKKALVENPTEHLIVQSIVNASKRILGRPVKLKELLSIDSVQSIASFYLASVPSPAELRFLFVLLVAHAGLLRTDELLSVRYKDINTEEHKMIIFIPKTKNDQYREGRFSNIYKSCVLTLRCMKKILRFQ